MKVENVAIEVYNNAIKQANYLNIDINKENIKKICENNIYFLKMQFKKIDNENNSKQVIINFYDKVLNKILLL